jgi:hypothetical protein
MTEIAKGWSKRRVLVTGSGPAFITSLKEAVSNVVMATVVDITNAGAILCIEGLNVNQLSALDSSGNSAQFNYLYSNFGDHAGYMPYTNTMLPNNGIKTTGRVFHELNVRWVNEFGALDTSVTYSSIELDLWSYSTWA